MSLANCEFAVTDVETTGIYPDNSDRVLEIAVIRTDQDGSILREYTTLINPLRDVGPIEKHGIWPRDVKDAPKFEEVVGDIVSTLAGAVVVAHNATFDVRFLNAEFRRAGYSIPEIPYVCTMHLAQSVSNPPPGRGLECACDYFGLERVPNHSAHADANATLALFRHCLQELRRSPDFTWEAAGQWGSIPPLHDWPSVPCSGISCLRNAVSREGQADSGFIASLIAKLPSVSEHTHEMLEYLALLDRVLEDRRISEKEGALLLQKAQELGLLREQVVAAHRTYLSDLAVLAYTDHYLTTDERKDLDDVRKLLEIDEREFREIVGEVPDGSSISDKSDIACLNNPKLTGKRVCFTGSLQYVLDGQQIDRQQAERIATEMGLIVDQNVTKRLDFLVAVDIDTMSGKAKKARDYGIPIISEAEFWRLSGLAE